MVLKMREQTSAVKRFQITARGHKVYSEGIIQPTTQRRTFQWTWEPFILVIANESLTSKLSSFQSRNGDWVEIKRNNSIIIIK